jgi:deazaflavin-dependent oxidoreductase (nitroreductase family)
MTKPELPEEVRQLNETLKRHPHLTEQMGPIFLFRVPGRTSGQLRSTPVAPLDADGQRWLVAGFAEADWVKNLRLSGWGILTKGTRSERVTVVEVAPEERAPILQAFVQQMEHMGGDSSGPSGHFAFAIGPDEPLEAYAAIADRHPIFRIVEATPAPSMEDAAR